MEDAKFCSLDSLTEQAQDVIKTDRQTSMITLADHRELSIQEKEPVMMREVIVEGEYLNITVYPITVCSKLNKS